MDASTCEDKTALVGTELCNCTATKVRALFLHCNKIIRCLQLGLLTYYSGLLTIEIALTHEAVYKVSLYFAHVS